MSLFFWIGPFIEAEARVGPQAELCHVRLPVTTTANQSRFRLTGAFCVRLPRRHFRTNDFRSSELRFACSAISDAPAGMSSGVLVLVWRSAFRARCKHWPGGANVKRRAIVRGHAASMTCRSRQVLPGPVSNFHERVSRLSGQTEQSFGQKTVLAFKPFRVTLGQQSSGICDSGKQGRLARHGS